jgi:hypothetical protein
LENTLPQKSHEYPAPGVVGVEDVTGVGVEVTTAGEIVTVGDEAVVGVVAVGVPVADCGRLNFSLSL